MRIGEKSPTDYATAHLELEGQMRRGWAIAALLGSFALISFVVGQSPSWSATQSDQARETAALPSVKKQVIDATGYAPNDVNLTWQANQFTVTIVNSGLNKATPQQREAEASKIVTAITKAIAGKIQYEKTLGMHIDYVARDSNGGHSDLIDGIDFRKDPTGRFVHHI